MTATTTSTTVPPTGAAASVARPFEPRQANPAFVLPDGFKGIGHLLSAVAKGGVPTAVLELVGLRVSQINGCSACIQGHWEEARRAGVNDARIIGVAAWRESPYFDDAERAALALAEALTRIADSPAEAVADDLWDDVTRHYDTTQVSALLLQIGTLNLFNRINLAVRERADRPSWKQ